MIYAGVKTAHVLNGERVCLLQDTLCALVLVIPILVLKIHRVAAPSHFHVDASTPHQSHSVHVFLPELRNEPERNPVRKTVEGI